MTFEGPSAAELLAPIELTTPRAGFEALSTGIAGSLNHFMDGKIPYRGLCFLFEHMCAAHLSRFICFMKILLNVLFSRIGVHSQACKITSQTTSACNCPED